MNTPTAGAAPDGKGGVFVQLANSTERSIATGFLIQQVAISRDSAVDLVAELQGVIDSIDASGEICQPHPSDNYIEHFEARAS